MSDPMAQLTDFVLKIKFLGSDEDSTQIRRVRLPRICNGLGNVSYEELVGLCVHLVIPEKPSNPWDFQVKLTYKDVDDDTVVIGCSEELLDAIDQYKEQRVLRITAEVKNSTKAKPPTPLPQAAADAPTSRASSHEPESSDAGVQTGGTDHSAGTPVLQSVVESVVNIILNAAVAINGRQGAQPEPAAPVFYTSEGVPSSSSASEVFPLEPTIVALPEPGETALSSNIPVEDTVTEAENEAEPSESAANEEQPFIHGRHTCDSCLTTPIVGKRYHALNMSDYDLCAKCFSDHGGGEIQFEAVELERDRHLQTRWHRRRERMNNNARGAASRFGTRAHHTRWGPNTNRGGPLKGLVHRLSEPHSQVPLPGIPPPPHGPFPPHPPKLLHPAMPTPPPHFGPAGGRDEQKAREDDAMAMAIKLSLMDLRAASTPMAPSQPASPVEVQSVKCPSSSSSRSSASTARSSTTTASKRSAEKKVEAKDKVVESLKVEAVKVAAVAKEPTAAPSAPTEEEVKSVDAEEPTVAPSAATEGEVKSTSGSVQVETVEEDEEESSVISEAFVVRMPSFDGPFTSDVSHGKGRQVNARSPAKGCRETSFSSDAAGNGAIADMLGETLDKCAEAIDAMVSELDRTSFDSRSATSSYAGVNDEADESFSSGVNDEGETILESVKAAQGQVGGDLQAEAGRGEEDWQVVGEDQQIGSDEELARAAQMIGSALFNSDMRSSGDMLSTLTRSAADSDAISYASSGLTSLPSVTTQVPAAQRQRWAPQLAQLRTLGIDDYARCVDILERLTAANIGCDSSDEVSVQEVINELWK